MTKPRTYYEILQVSPDAAQEVISSAYRTLMSKLRKHPDLGGDIHEAQLINEAYETISDPAKRAEYDVMLSDQGAAQKKSPKPSVERRRAPRRAANSTVSYCIAHDSKWYPARVRDISILGVRIQSHQPLFKGQHIVVAPSNPAATAFHGTIRWSRMFHPSVFERVYEAGIEFPDQIADIEQRLSI